MWKKRKNKFLMDYHW